MTSFRTPSPALTGSLWLDREREHPADPLPPGGTFDVLVVGGGITGLTTALLLARAGRAVGVVEAGELGGLTTGHTTAKVSLLQGTKLSRMARVRGDGVAAAYLEGNREGAAWLRRFCEDHGVTHQERPAATMATSEGQTSTIRDEHRVAERLGLPVSWVDNLPVPFPTYGATRLEGQFQLDPIELVDALTAQLREHGGTVHPHRRVRTASYGDDRVEVRLDDDQYLYADHVVLATGAPILDRGMQFAQLEPMRSYLLAFENVGDVPEPMMVSAGSPSRSLRDAPQRGADVLLVGGSGHPVGRTSSELRHVDELRAWVDEWFPGARETHGWSAQDYSSSGGGVPQVGVLPFAGGRIHVATGYDKWGMTNGTAAALTLAGELLGERPAWSTSWRLPALDPRALPGLLLTNLKVGAAQVRTMASAAMRSVPEDPAPGEGAVGRSLPLLKGRAGAEDGSTCAVAAVCTHLGGTLKWNDAERTWDCPLHGSRFEPDGAVIEGPATRPLARG